MCVFLPCHVSLFGCSQNNGALTSASFAALQTVGDYLGIYVSSKRVSGVVVCFVVCSDCFLVFVLTCFAPVQL